MRDQFDDEAPWLSMPLSPSAITTSSFFRALNQLMQLG
jgi:hypothetical protein